MMHPSGASAPDGVFPPPFLLDEGSHEYTELMRKIGRAGDGLVFFADKTGLVGEKGQINIKLISMPKP